MTIIVCPLSQAPNIAREKNVSHVVSLLDPGTAFPHIEGLPDERRLRLSVHDIEHEAEDHHPPAHPHIDAILSFVAQWDAAAPLLIHCYAGISRSTATAFITACVRNPNAQEKAIAETLRAASPTASPNRRFVALADDVLGRQGRMIDAINAIGRGPPWYVTGEAAPFSIPARYSP